MAGRRADRKTQVLGNATFGFGRQRPIAFRPVAAQIWGLFPIDGPRGVCHRQAMQKRPPKRARKKTSGKLVATAHDLEDTIHQLEETARNIEGTTHEIEDEIKRRGDKRKKHPL